MVESVALVVAAGRGHRFGGELPKQYLRLGGQPLLRHGLQLLSDHPGIDAVRAVIHPDDRALYDEAAAGLALLEPCHGGLERQDSVRLGLESLSSLPGGAPEKVLIHDGARPFPGPALLDRLLAALDRHDGAIPALRVTDTLKRERSDGDGPDRLCGETVSRDGLWRAQTPQAFRFQAILAAHRALAGEALTDDAALAERAGLRVALVEGEEENFKVTTPEDLARAERLLSSAGPTERETRLGNGFDVHRFGPGDHVMLCGVAIEHGQGLVGHSDADVGLHALTDALLGAIGAGDIGQHFPPSDPRWKGADSAAFLAHAASLVGARGGRIVNLDVTLICERPKVGPHREAMRSRIAGILGIAVERVGVKATTTEGLGFTGRREGIAAQASASVELPAGDAAPGVDSGQGSSGV